MEPMGNHLSAQGITTKGITLPGHGASLEDFAGISNPELIGRVEFEYTKLKQNCDSVVIVGFSMGGLLALQLATMRDVEGIVTICAPVFPRGGSIGERAIRYVARLGAAFNANIPKFGFASLADKALAEYMVGHQSYPSRSVLRLMDLMDITRAVIGRVNAPILVVQSRRDDVIWKKSGEYIFSTVGSKDKKLIHLENSRHKAPIDKDRHILFNEISRFCASCAGRPASGRHS
jgi:carboxylesterase